MPPDPSPIEANMSQFRTLASPPYDVNAPKPKREKLTRSRDGCLTCRIRRKKCSGMPDVGGACESCQRLAIECLGYSAKRPQWMQNNEKLNECRREIRLWLAERGKGPRAVELLSLAKYYGDDGTSAPLTVPSPNNKLKSNASNERRTRRMANAMSWVEEEDELDDGEEDGDEDGDGEREEMEMDHQKLETITNTTVLSAPNLVNVPPNAVPAHLQFHPHLHPTHSSVAQQLHHSQQHPQPQVASSLRQPASSSSTSRNGVLSNDLNQTYCWNFLDESPDGENDQEGASKLPEDHPRATLSNVRDSGTSSLLNDAPVASLVTMWTATVRPFAHRFANPKYFQELCQIMISEPDVQAVTRNLAAIHGFTRNFGKIDAPEVKTARVELTKVQMAVKAKLLEDSRSHTPTVGHALAAIFGLSYVLFTGGNGDWNSYLEVATNWLDRECFSILEGSAKYSYATAFLSETTIWIDILGSVSLQHAPKLHKYYVKFLSNDENAENAHGLFLSRVMGCENRVMLGIATISALAGWKIQQAATVAANPSELKEKAHSIELAYLTPPKQPLTFQLTALPNEASNIDDSANGGVSSSGSQLPSLPAEPVPLSYEKPIDRPSITAVFRASAKVYLNVVVHGSLPENEHVSKSVEEAIELIKSHSPAPGSGELDRAMLFALTVVGAVVKTTEHKTFVRQRFKAMKNAERIGNNVQALKILEDVWRKREVAADTTADWWSVSRELGASVLLA